MNILKELLSNHMLVSAAAGWSIAQIIKAIIDFTYCRKFSMERLLGSGGMPSSHAATVTALTTAAAIQYGFDSSQFALSCVLSMIVMYDACGVRRATGEHAKMLNDLHKILNVDMTPGERLKELVGHTPIQVLMGAVTGVIVGTLLNWQ